MAEAYAISKGMTARSAGYMPGIPLSKKIHDCAHELGLSLTEESQGITHDLTLWSDRIIIIDDFDSTPLSETSVWSSVATACWEVSSSN